MMNEKDRDRMWNGIIGVGLALAAFLLLVAFMAPAKAHDGFHGSYHGGYHGGDHDGGHWHGSIWIGPGIGFGPYYGPYYQPYPYVYAPPPPVYVAPPPPQPQVWYWCPTAQQYYPNVQTCNVPWQPVSR